MAIDNFNKSLKNNIIIWLFGASVWMLFTTTFPSKPIQIPTDIWLKPEFHVYTMPDCDAECLTILEEMKPYAQRHKIYSKKSTDWEEM